MLRLVAGDVRGQIGKLFKKVRKLLKLPQPPPDTKKWFAISASIPPPLPNTACFTPWSQNRTALLADKNHHQLPIVIAPKLKNANVVTGTGELGSSFPTFSTNQTPSTFLY
jgi:hypothetical protein